MKTGSIDIIIHTKYAQLLKGGKKRNYTLRSILDISNELDILLRLCLQWHWKQQIASPTGEL